MICKHCGAEVDDKGILCIHCGKLLKEKLAATKYDFIVLQDNGNADYSDSKPAMDKLIPMVEKNGAKPVLYKRYSSNDDPAQRPASALRHHKKKGYLPSVISIDNIAASEKTTPMLTTIDIPKREMVHFAVSLLIDRQKNLHKEHVRIELPCHLIERESCSYC